MYIQHYVIIIIHIVYTGHFIILVFHCSIVSIVIVFMSILNFYALFTDELYRSMMLIMLTCHSQLAAQVMCPCAYMYNHVYVC